MSSLSLPKIQSLLIRTEEQDPIIVFCQIGYAAIFAALLLWYISSYAGGHALTATVFFTVRIGLYLTSAAYHYHHSNRSVRFLDQVMISIFIPAEGLMFLLPAWWAFVALIGISSFTIYHKWREHCDLGEQNNISSLIFLRVGILSTIIMVALGMPNVGIAYLSGDGLLAYSAICAYLAAESVYRNKIGGPRRWCHVWGYSENKHFLIFISTAIMTYLVMKYVLI